MVLSLCNYSHKYQRLFLPSKREDIFARLSYNQAIVFSHVTILQKKTFSIRLLRVLSFSTLFIRLSLVILSLYHDRSNRITSILTVYTQRDNTHSFGVIEIQWPHLRCFASLLCKADIAGKLSLNKCGPGGVERWCGSISEASSQSCPVVLKHRTRRELSRFADGIASRRSRRTFRET